MPVKVEKASGETVVMGFKPDNITVHTQTSPLEAEDAIADEAGTTKKEMTVLKGNAKAAFANQLFSLKEKFGDRTPDAREIVVLMADTLDTGGGHVSMAVQQDDQTAGVLLRPMYPAAEAPGSKDGKELIILCIYRATMKSERNLQRTIQAFVGNTHDPKISQYPAEEVKRLLSVLDANAKKFESNMRSSEVWRKWFLKWADKVAADGQLTLPRALPTVDNANGFVQSFVTTSDFAKVASECRSRGTCGHCGKTAAKQRCDRCGLVFYCSRECQKSAWPEHKLVCKSASDKLEHGDIVTADVTIPPPGMAGMMFKSLNLNAPVSKISSGSSSKVNIYIHTYVYMGVYICMYARARAHTHTHTHTHTHIGERDHHLARRRRREHCQNPDSRQRQHADDGL